MEILAAEDLTIGYKQKRIIDRLSLRIQEAEICTIIGPNGSGKSTLLRALSRNFVPQAGQVKLRGKNMYALRPREVAKRVALLTQKPQAPGDLMVKDLVMYGRYPHRTWRGTERDDEQIVAWALNQTNMTPLADRKLDALSGGEGQRAWLAMALAQRPEILILDEPTTYLDIRHQLELMELIREINVRFNLTVLMVLHDLNQASKYSDRLIVLKQGLIYANGTPQEVICHTMLRDVFGVECELRQDKRAGNPVCDPIGLSSEVKDWKGEREHEAIYINA